MQITEEQARNNYPLQAVRFMHTFDSDLSNETDEYGVKKCKPDSFKRFEEVDKKLPQRLLNEYEDAVKDIHNYLDKGLQL